MPRKIPRTGWLRYVPAILALLAPGFAPADEAAAPPPPQSPYFQVGDDSGVDHFPLKDTRVTAELNGVIASVHVHQRYRNEGTRALNAKYIFPGSTGAAVNAMVMTIGDRRIRAQIKEKEQAQQDVRGGESRRADRVAAGAEAAQRVFDGRRQHRADTRRSRSSSTTPSSSRPATANTGSSIRVSSGLAMAAALSQSTCRLRGSAIRICTRASRARPASTSA